MNVPGLSWHYLWSRPLASALNLLLLTLGLASMAFVLIAKDQIDNAFERDLAGIDVVVGAKGSPMQLILAGVFHMDVPPGNVPLAEVQALASHPQVAQVIPLSLGDSVAGFRIVGTHTDYPAHYRATLAQGTLWTKPMQAVMGAQVVQSTGVQLGQTFTGTHGMGGGGGHEHADMPYTVVGLLAPCACVLDRLVLTDTASVWEVHEGLAPGEFESLSPEDREAIQAEREVTMALVRYNTPMAAIGFPRFINSTTKMQAAAPALEITRLLSMVGVGTRVLQGMGAVLLLVAALSVFIALWSAVRERRADLALLRMLGAPPRKVAALLLCEALWLALLATLIGVLAGQELMAALAWFLQLDKSVLISGLAWPAELWSVPALAVGVALLSALLPAWEAYRANVFELLQSR